jgi:hypothetical protein
MYERTYEGERVLVVCSFAKKNLRFSFPGVWKKGERELLLSNYAGADVKGVSSLDSAPDTESESASSPDNTCGMESESASSQGNNTAMGAKSASSQNNARGMESESTSSPENKPDTREERILRPYEARVYVLRAEAASY